MSESGAPPGGPGPGPYQPGPHQPGPHPPGPYPPGPPGQGPYRPAAAPSPAGPPGAYPPGYPPPGAYPPPAGAYPPPGAWTPYGQYQPPARGFRAPAGEPRPYHQLLRSPSYRWWRPVVSLAVGIAVAFVAVIGTAVVVGALLAAFGDGPAAESSLTEGPGGFLAGNLLIAVGTPVAMVAIVAGFLRPPAWLVSVELRPRWDWLARVSGVLVVWAVVGSLVWFVLSGWPGTGGDQALLLIVLCLLTTPLQAAGEEFLVRGWITQSVGAWFARPLPGAVVAGLVSATVFALLHGSQNVWLFGDRFVFGLIASYLVWRTGGLEAAIALHTISNISSIIPAALEGSLDDALTLTSAPVGTVALDVVMLLVAAFVVVWLARRRGVTRLGPVAPSAQGAPPAH
jgi:uncharacterized protein